MQNHLLLNQLFASRRLRNGDSNLLTTTVVGAVEARSSNRALNPRTHSLESLAQSARQPLTHPTTGARTNLFPHSKGKRGPIVSYICHSARMQPRTGIDNTEEGLIVAKHNRSGH
jgi:hypothetical protein